jgi:hypothetical protein
MEMAGETLARTGAETAKALQQFWSFACPFHVIRTTFETAIETTA